MAAFHPLLPFAAQLGLDRFETCEAPRVVRILRQLAAPSDGFCKRRLLRHGCVEGESP
jgi:hypothetical protein